MIYTSILYSSPCYVAIYFWLNYLYLVKYSIVHIKVVANPDIHNLVTTFRIIHILNNKYV